MLRAAPYALAAAMWLASTGGTTFGRRLADRLVAHRGRATERTELAGARIEGSSSWLRVPHAAAPVVLDGDNDDPGWLATPGPARTGPFASEDGAPARPYSDARILWGDGDLYVLLYAADVDVRSHEDAFRLTFSCGSHDVSVRVVSAFADGTLKDVARGAQGEVDRTWRSGAHVSREIDGTIDDPSDTDEEWSLEMAVPLASLGMKGEPGESVGFAVERCDAPRTGARACGGWGAARPSLDQQGGRIVLE